MVSMNRPAVLMAAVARRAKSVGGGADSIISSRLELVGRARKVTRSRPMRGSFRASRVNSLRTPRCVFATLPVCSKM
jgi:hypothetical protein